LTVQDTRTPPLLDAIYEQITRGAAGYSDLARCNDLSDEHNNDQVITDWSLGYSHLAARLAAHELDLRNARMQRENQGREVAVQRIYTEFVNSLDRQLEFSSAREQKLHADLHASEQDRGRLMALVSSLEASRRDQQGWEQSAAKANARCAEAEMTASNLRADLAAATDRVRNVQEQLDHEIEVASGKDSVIQSITEESRWTYTRLRLSKDMIKRRDKLLDERDRRLREMKELLDEKAMIQDRCESEMRRLKQEAQEQLDTLRDALSQLRPDRRSPLDNDHRLRYQPPTTWPYDTGQPSLPPERILDTGTPPISSAINPNPDPSLRFTKWSPPSHSQVQGDSSTRRSARLYPGSKVAKKQRAAQQELADRMRHIEPASAGYVKPNERDETCLREELVTAKELLRLSEEQVRDLRRELDRSRETFCEVETRVRALEHELDICQAKLQEARDAQHASEVNFAEAAQLLRVHQVESESSMARAEESQFKCSQATFLCAALQERVTELEAEVKKLKSTRKYRTHSKSSSRRPTDTFTGMHELVYAVSYAYISLCTIRS
jgi:chromosome segregation ATPase